MRGAVWREMLRREELLKMFESAGAVRHAEQLLKGDRYELLQPTYGICFLNEPLFDDAVYHHCFRVYDAEHQVLLCKDLELHLIELSKFDVPVELVQTQLQRWCYFSNMERRWTWPRYPRRWKFP